MKSTEIFNLQRKLLDGEIDEQQYKNEMKELRENLTYLKQQIDAINESQRVKDSTLGKLILQQKILDSYRP